LFALTVMIGLTGCTGAQWQQMAANLDRAMETPQERSDRERSNWEAQVKKERAMADQNAALADAWIVKSKHLPADQFMVPTTREDDKFSEWARTASTEQVRQAIKVKEREDTASWAVIRAAEAKKEAAEAKAKADEKAYYALQQKQARQREAQEAKADKKFWADKKAEFDRMPKAEQERHRALAKQMQDSAYERARVESERKRIQQDENANWNYQVNKQRAYQKALVPR